MNATWRILFFTLLLPLLSSCVNLLSYRTTPDPMPEKGQVLKPLAEAKPNGNCMTTRNCTMYVEYDDFGHLYDRAQLNNVVRTARDIADQRGIIVVYVHGWHHNASEGDPDSRQFERAIVEAEEMDRLKYGDNRRVMGIYVGWRGESIDEKVAFPLSVLTFWERKNTAHAVGDGAVFELFRKLADIREQYPESRLVLVGHSFGGAVTYSSVSHSITAQIIDDEELNEETVSDSALKRWDLVVLINPAFEAMLLRPNFELARSREYKSTQLPHLVIVTSKADWATRTLFPLGRNLSTTFKKYPEKDTVSGPMNTTAVGHYIPYVTHQLSVSEDKCKLKTMNYAKVEGEKELKTVATNHTYCLNDDRALKEDAKSTFLTRCDAAGDCTEVADNEHYIQRGTAAAGYVPDAFPILNIRTTKEVMKGHTDIWNPTMRGFITQLLLVSVPPERPKK
jgi:pimeloyl-ACP methyl ester carboxylesterase